MYSDTDTALHVVAGAAALWLREAQQPETSKASLEQAKRNGSCCEKSTGSLRGKEKQAAEQQHSHTLISLSPRKSLFIYLKTLGDASSVLSRSLAPL